MSISTVQAFDMLPYAVGIYEKLDLKAVGIKEAREIAKRNEDLAKRGLPEKTTKDKQWELGLFLAIYVAKNISKIREEFFGIVAIVCEISVEQAINQPLAQSIKAFKDVFTDKELWDFFEEAMK